MTTKQFKTRLENVASELGILSWSHALGFIEETDEIENLTREEIKRIEEAEEIIRSILDKYEEE